MAQCIRKDGIHKKSFPDRAAARQAARFSQASYGKLEPYRCDVCRRYHIGHAKRDDR